MIHQFTVSEARNAIACPRIFYFDEQRYRRQRSPNKRLTRIWGDSSEPVAGCGTLFHHAIERFNALAGRADNVLAILKQAQTMPGDAERVAHLTDQLIRFINTECLHRQRLGRKLPPTIEAFKTAVRQYTSELANIFSYALRHDHSPEMLVEEFFGDTRKRMDVTFYVGPGNTPIRVRGILDYIYFDHRQAAQRILDFKLLPGDVTSKDQLQTSLYALMHHQQHGTQANTAVLYLYPQRRMAEKAWAKVYSERHKVFNLLASMAAWSQYDEEAKTGLLPPGTPALCQNCPWNRHGQCEQRLGPKQQGKRSEPWKAKALASGEPQIVAHRPPEVPEPETYDDEELAETDAPEEHAAPDIECQPVTVTTSNHSDNEITPAAIYLGRTHVGNQVVTMPLSSLTTHVSILGAAGSGKSWVAKGVAEEAIRNGVPVLAIDPQGDLVQFLREANLPAQASAAEKAALRQFREQVDVRLWTPGSSHAQRLCLSPLRLPKPTDLQGFESEQRRHEAWEAMLGVAAGNIVQLAQAGGDEEVQQTFILEILRKLTRQQGRSDSIGLSDIVAAIAAPESLGLDDVEHIISKRERERLKQRITARERGPTSNLFSGGTPLDLDHFVTPRLPGKTPLNVVYLNALPDDNQKQFFVAALAAEVYRWMITSPSSGQVKLLLYLDEARDFLPAGTSRPPAKEPLLRLFAQGRKFGVSCLICTQSPRSVDYQVFSNASTKLIGRLESAQDVERVGEWFKDAGGRPEWLTSRIGASKGDFIGRWPEMAAELEGQSYRSRPLYSLHEGAWSAERVEQEWKQAQS